jgi:dolichol-phosphate mannosyltransferase
LVANHGGRLVCYGLVGGSGVLVNMGMLYALVAGAGWNHIVAAGIASELSILTNFALNDRWTFSDRQPGTWVNRVLQYNAVALGGMVISLTVLAALTGIGGLHYLLANLIAIAVATLSNYVLNMRFTWGLTPDLPAPIDFPSLQQAVLVPVESAEAEISRSVGW